ncbi:transcription factor IBH1-like [Populus alba x Populus x berolinensis]|uniref:Transcription factor IBH1-like n=1 Tax=Populus alba x Populus x berolinensis TaxID=444605 RepID=A0AAD6PZE8_9ROSI|nr:transcription factor IBH1-like [Populus alba x Populus x berolinensis]
MTSKHVTATAHMGSIKNRFARRFLRSLLKVKRSDRLGTGTGFRSNDEEIRKRNARRIKTAAYRSMARVVGPRKIWSRALLFKLRNRARIQGAGLRKRSVVSKKKRVLRKENKVQVISREPSRADNLRKLVPGGDSMHICSLLDETAHYIKCLATQVKVMQSIADRFIL